MTHETARWAARVGEGDSTARPPTLTPTLSRVRERGQANTVPRARPREQHDSLSPRGEGWGEGA